MRLAWLTDIHLEFAAAAGIETLLEEIADARPDVVLLGGDIGKAASVMGYLRRLAKGRRPWYFVLGNHDFYGGSIAALRAEAARLTIDHDRLLWLSGSGIVPLTPKTALIGHDGWGDGGFGNAATTKVMLNDFMMIDELRTPSHEQRMERLGLLGQEAATHLASLLPGALAQYEHVVVLTHVPPFAEAAWHDGRQSNADWLPYFACRAAGDTLRSAMALQPGRRMTVLCGHTHGAGECSPLPNLTVLTGGAEYGQPHLQRVIEVT